MQKAVAAKAVRAGTVISKQGAARSWPGLYGRRTRHILSAPVPNSDGKIGRVDAIRLADQSTVWSFRQRAPSTSAVLPTGGGLVFTGDLDRYFKALDDAPARCCGRFAPATWSMASR
jgi:hypothetical protein